MATIYNKHDYQFAMTPNPGDITFDSLGDGTTMVFNGAKWAPSLGDGIIVGSNTGKSLTMSVLEEWMKEQDLEAKYPSLAAAREQYNIIKAMCQETNNDPS